MKNRRPLRFLAIAFFLSFAARVSPAADGAGPLTVDALTSLSSLSRLWPIGSLSADGRSLAYTFRAGSSAASAEGGGPYEKSGLMPDYATGTDVWIADTRTGAAERVTDGKGAVEEPAISPDGNRVAFFSDRDGVGHIWVWSRDTRSLRRVSDAVVRPSFFGGAHLRWTPDGRSLIALVLPEGMTVEQANARGGAPAAKAENDPTVVPGSTVVVRRSAARPPAKEKEASGPPAAGAPSEGEKKTDDMDTSHLFAVMESDVAVVDVASGRVRRVAGGKAVFWFAPSPDGKWVAFSHQSGRRPSKQEVFYDIEAAPLAGGGGTARTLARFTRADYGYCTWSPDSTRIAYVAEGGGESGDVHVVDAASAADRLVSTGSHPGFGEQADLKAFWTPDGRALLVAAVGRLWTVPSAGGPLAPVTVEKADREVVQVIADAGTNIAWSGDGGRTVTAVVRDPVAKNMGFARIALADGRAERLRDEPKRYGGSYSPPITSGDGSLVVWSAEDAQHPPDLWGASGNLASARQLTHLNPQIEKLELGKSRVIEYRGIDGKPLRGALLLPAGYREGERVPLIVRPYPGPYTHSDAVNRFGLEGSTDISNMQMFATRGYAVLSPEIPQRLGTPMRDLMEGIHVAVNRVIDLGIADPNRLGIIGQSYGGYTTISVVVQTDRFKAAVMCAGLGDLFSYYGNLDASGADSSSWAEAGQGLMGGTPWEHRQRYFENSPIFLLDRVTTPVLILHGNKDRAVPITQANEVFVGLRRLGREVEFREYAGEEHVPEGRENLIDFWNAVLRWFDKYVKNAPSPAS
jgi:dipeptidyl aminopeptidase/acylaminoacyl peptidase